MIWEILAALTVGALLALTSATIWSRKETWVRGAAVAALFLVTPVVCGVGIFALSHPVEYDPRLVPSGEYLVLGTKLVQDEAIYLWLDFGQGHPRYVYIPWDNETANKLADLMRKQKNGGIEGFTAILPPYEHSWDKNMEFHPLPQPVIPIPKNRNEEPQRYEREA